MARKRDHKREYQQRKQKALAAGYASVSSYRNARKTLRVPRNASPIPLKAAPKTVRASNLKTQRRQSAAWSKQHSRQARSKYSAGFSDERTALYWRAYVAPMPEGIEKKKAIGLYVSHYHDKRGASSVTGVAADFVNAVAPDRPALAGEWEDDFDSDDDFDYIEKHDLWADFYDYYDAEYNLDETAYAGGEL